MEITIANKQLRKLLGDKDELVTKGRNISSKIEKVEKQIEDMKVLQRKYTDECNPDWLINQGDALQKEINGKIEELEAIGEEVQKLKIAAIPKEHVSKYETLKAEKEELERERNKVFLKVQKIKDRAVPIIQAEVKPKLSKYEDINTADIKGDVIVVTTFSHLEDWKAKFEEKNPTAPEL